MSRTAFPERDALRAMFHLRAYRAAYLLLGPSVALLYALLLPGLLFGTLQPWVLRFLTPVQAAFALGAGALLPLVLLLNAFLWRRSACTPRDGSGSALASLVVGVVPNALCCTPLIPTALSVFLAGASLMSVSGPVQRALNEGAWVLYAASLLAMWGALRLAARRWARGEAAAGSAAASAGAEHA